MDRVWLTSGTGRIFVEDRGMVKFWLSRGFELAEDGPAPRRAVDPQPAPAAARSKPRARTSRKE